MAVISDSDENLLENPPYDFEEVRPDCDMLYLGSSVRSSFEARNWPGISGTL
jgi:hypothetical protein